MSFDWIHAALLGLVIGTALSAAGFAARDRRSRVLDALSLANHFVGLPLLQASLVLPLLHWLLPAAQGTWSIGWLAALGITMAIDYLWYWNHRLFHAPTPLWQLHAVHHSATDLDILASPRNSLISPFFMVYFWLSPLALYLARDPFPLLTIFGLSLLINFWGHSRFNFRAGSWPHRILALAIIQPNDHFWHHSQENTACNFATVFNFWDRLHGTWYSPAQAPQHLGFAVNLPLWRQMVFPWGRVQA